MESYFLGFDPVTLRERFDLAAAQDRLDALGDLRGLDVLVEKTSLQRVLGRLEEAWESSTEALR